VRSFDITQTSPACRRRARDYALGPDIFVLSMNAQLVSRIKYFRGPAVMQFEKNDSYQGFASAMPPK
jgi:hypothetical protein